MTFEKLLEEDGRLVYTNKGVSMLPLLRQNKDVMVIEKTDHYNVLDAVLFRRASGAYVLHRILRVNPDGTYWIVGDNCVSGETVRPEQLLGVLTARVRNGRKLSMSSPLIRLYTRTWCRWYPFRFAVLRLLNFTRRVLAKVYRTVWPKKKASPQGEA